VWVISTTKEGLVLSRKIYTAINNPVATFFSCNILGERGIGKSVYALKGIHGTFVQMGMSENEAWRATLRCLHYKIEDVINFLLTAVEEGRREPVLLWDDVGVHAGSSKYFSQMLLVEKLKGCMDVIRTSVACLLMTTPTRVGLLGILKNYDDFQVKIYHSPRGGWYRVARGYKWSTIPSGKRCVYKKFRDSYSCYLPNLIFNQYKKKRETALKDALISLSDSMGKNK